MALAKVTKWFELGLSLGVRQEQLEKIKLQNKSIDDCLSEMVSAWLDLDFVGNVFEKGRPCWRRLAVALQCMDYCEIADAIASSHKKT